MDILIWSVFDSLVIPTSQQIGHVSNLNFIKGTCNEDTFQLFVLFILLCFFFEVVRGLHRKAFYSEKKEKSKITDFTVTDIKHVHW